MYKIVKIFICIRSLRFSDVYKIAKIFIGTR